MQCQPIELNMMVVYIRASPLSRDILKAFYVNKLLAIPKFKGFQEPLF